ncbi:hypothetical protein G6F57_020973 [Rhizopus arrhizus]|nr:hypothetical protein G6F57_020973 [Rhizopus arrhizus]
MGAGDVFGQVEVMHAGLRAQSGHCGGAMERQGVDHGIGAFDRARHRGVVADLARLATQFGQDGQAGGVLVGNQHGIIAAAFQHQGDGETDFSGAQQNDGTVEGGHGATPAMRGDGLASSYAGVLSICRSEIVVTA